MEIKKITSEQLELLNNNIIEEIAKILEEKKFYSEEEIVKTNNTWFRERCGYVTSLKDGELSDDLRNQIESKVTNVESTVNAIADRLNNGDKIDGLEQNTIEVASNKMADLILKIAVDRVLVGREIDDARAQGDLSENAEYDAARDKQGELEGQISALEAWFEKLVIIDKSDIKIDVVSINSTVTYKRIDNNKEFTFKIVSSFDANPLNGEISQETVVGSSLMNAKVGDKINIRANKEYVIELLGIER